MMPELENRWIRANVWAYQNALRISQAATIDDNQRAKNILLIAAIGTILKDHERNEAFIENVEALRKEWGE